MKKNYILALFLAFVIIVTTYFITISTDNVVQVKDTISKSEYSLKEISDVTQNYTISAYIPITKINLLDNKLEEEYNNIIKDFKDKTKDLKLMDDGKKFNLNINSVDYVYDDDYISFLISYSMDLGGAHPDTDLVTINYNKKNNTFIDIDYLVSKNNKILESFSEKSYNSFKDREEFKDCLATLKKRNTPTKRKL